MFDDSILAPRPPYITFERRAVEKRKLIEEGGASYYVDVDFALVTPQGSKDILEKIVDEWFPRLADECRQGRFNPAWLNAYKESYTAWKNDQEPPLNGMSIKLWPGASPAEIKQLVAVRVLTVEDLAAANEEMLNRIGMGARSLKQRAVDWLTGKNGQGPLIEQLDGMRQQNESLQARLAALTAQVEGLQTMLNSRPEQQQQAPAVRPLEDRLADSQGRRDESDIDAALNDLTE
jgi:hypothetical protein